MEHFSNQLKQASDEILEEESNRNIQKKSFIENRAIRLFGSISEQMKMKREEIEVYKEKFQSWKKDFDNSMSQIPNNVRMLGRKCYLG